MRLILRLPRPAFLLIISILIFSISRAVAAVPPNDSCGGAIPINISSAGYGLGTFTSPNADISDATIQATEVFAPAIFGSGLDKKSIWYRFTLVTPRAVRVTLAQPGTSITAGDVGFAVYKTNSCLPQDADISSKLTPIGTFGNTYHPCVEPGEYLVQVSSNNKASGAINISIEVTEASPSPYDKPATAHQFGKLTTNKVTAIDFPVECQSLDNALENCLPNSSFKDFTKSTWHTFTTPDYFDWFSVLLSETNSGNYAGANYTIGYRIYEGDAVTTPVSSLIMLGGCDSMNTNGYYLDKKIYKCGQLKAKTTYTVQLLFHKDFVRNMRLAVAWDGTAPANGPQPITLPAPNNMGTLNADVNYITNTSSDNFGCNTRHSLYACPKTLPVNGVSNAGFSYNLSTFFSFKLATAATLNFSVYGNPQFLSRLYKQTLTSSCTDLDTANLKATFVYTSSVSCLDAGDYVLQVMGVDSMTGNNYYFGQLYTTTSSLNLQGNLGQAINVTIQAKTEVATNKFSLNAANAFDKLNANALGVMQPLVPYTTYTAVTDTFGCANTVLPDTAICQTYQSKAAYREFVVADSSMILPVGSFGGTAEALLYKGDANALATAQNVFNYPGKISGLIPYSKCLTYNYNSMACVVPGTYTLASFDYRVGTPSTLQITQYVTKTKHATPATAQDMGDLWSYMTPNTYYRSDVDTFTCINNADTIGGMAPCNSFNGMPAKKLIYRQFYLSKPSSIILVNGIYPYSNISGTGTFTLFTGKATDGLSTLVPLGAPWTCFTSASTPGQCDELPAGWYTMVSYGSGPSYSDPLGDLPGSYQYSNIGQPDCFYVQLRTTCVGPQFNRPHKASIDTVTNKPYLIEWGPQTGHTAAYPVTSKKYTLNQENFNCTVDTAFIRQHMKPCHTAENMKVAFYVFKITQASYVQIDNIPGGLWSSVYAFDVRSADSVKLKTDSALQTCMLKSAAMEFCMLQPGTYTLVIFAPSGWICNTVTPTIYIDQVGYSRFDHASKAYDFGAVKPDSAWYNGKPGDINPLNSGRAPSDDIFYCTSGSQKNDPSEAACMSLYNPNIYNTGNNVVLHPNATDAPDYTTIDRRNLWYTFTINHPGKVRVKVKNKTPGKNAATHQFPFAIYKTDEDASLPFSNLVSNGKVDSTSAQGLTYITRNHAGGQYYAFCQGSEEIEFYVDPCSFTPTRYYVMVENRNTYYYDDVHAINPNSQLEVSLLLDSASAIQPKFDHFSQANDLGTVNSGIKKGAVDNFTCATADPTDPLYAYTTCQKTLWYKFTTTVTGQVRYAAFFKNTNEWYYDHIQLFRQIKPNDSSATGLAHMPYTTNYSNNGTWAQQCISPGTYYILLPGCNALDQDVYPQIEIIPEAGDFCSAPMVASLNGAGSKVVSVKVDCHTIGTDYGEFNTTLSCPPGATTATYKTSWYRLDISGADTLDVTVFINEKTNAGSSEIKYRMMTGTCGAMQEQSCVLDALTQNTYKCLAPGNSYFIQVFTPVLINGYTPVTGDIDLNISAIAHADTCAPLAPCLSSANFTTTYNCTNDEAIKFNNFSTYGTAIKYKWDFGFGGQSSTAVSPSFVYPSLATDKTYDVKLVIENTDCARKDSVIKTISIPGRPVVDFGSDLVQCSGASVTLNAASFTGATYVWQNGSTDPTFTANTPGLNQYSVKVTYNNCVSIDTINIMVNPITKKPVKNLVLCSGDSLVLDENRGLGETFKWNTGATVSSILVKTPGLYWVDISYVNCTIRDTFSVSTISTARPLGRDTAICLGLGTYNLNATTGGALSYQWQDGSSSSSFQVNNAGLYWVNMNFGNCSIRDSVYISNFPAAININMVEAICAGSNYTLPWGQNVGISGIYRDTIRYASGCDSLINRVALTVHTKPAIGTDKAVDICSGKTTNLAAQFTTGGLTTSWSLGGTIITDVSAVSVAGVYQLIATNVAGCSDTAFVTVTVNAKPGVGIDEAITVCPGTTVDLTAQFNTSGLTTSWTNGGIAVPGPSGVMSAGSYQLIATNNFGCTDTAMFTISISPKPSLGANQTISICAGLTTDLTTRYNTAGLTANWTFNNAVVNDPSKVSAAGAYQLIASNADGCSDTAFIDLTIDPKPVLGIDKAVAICSGNSFDLGTSFVTDGLTTNWTLAGIPVTNPAAVYTQGVYQLIATSAQGCIDSAVITITVNAKPGIGADTSLSICPGNIVNLENLFVTTGLASNWTSGNVPVTTPSSVTEGVYQLIVSSTSGCFDTARVTVVLNSKPVLGNDTVTSICPGYTADLTRLFNIVGLTSNWSLNAVAVVDPAAVSVAGIYRLIVTNATGCMDTAAVTVTVAPKPSAGADKSIVICAGVAVDLTTQYTTTGLTVNWTINGSPVLNPSFITAAGSYQLIVANNAGCSDTAIVTITVNPKPDLGADKALAACAGNSIDLTKEYNTTGLTTRWTSNGALVSNPSVITSSGIYQLIVNNNFTCADTAIVTVTINTNPTISITNPPPVCTPVTVDLTLANVTAGSSTGLVYSYWKDGGTTTPHANAAATTDGVYYIKGTDANGCFNSRPVTVVVYPLPMAIAGRDTTICDNTIAILRGSSANQSGGTVSYLWSPAGTLAKADTSTTIASPVGTATYTLTATVNFGTCNLSVTDEVTINMQPLVPAFAGNDTIAVKGVPHQLVASGGANYLWSPSGPLNNAMSVKPLAILQQDTRFVVTVTDFAGCVGTDTVFIKVYDGVTYYLPNAFSPNADGLNDIFRPVPVGVVSTDYFRIYSRYGQLIFETTKWMHGWDGTYKGQKQPVGNYVWIIKGVGRNGKVIEMKGNVVLVR